MGLPSTWSTQICLFGPELALKHSASPLDHQSRGALGLWLWLWFWLRLGLRLRLGLDHRSRGAEVVGRGSDDFAVSPVVFFVMLLVSLLLNNRIGGLQPSATSAVSNKAGTRVSDVSVAEE